MSGTAMASPVMNIICTPYLSTISQVRTGSNLGSRIVTCPEKRCISSDACAPPCMSGLSGSEMSDSLERLLGLVELLDRLAGHEVDASTERPPEVLVAPHHALGEPGGPAGVDDVQVVRAPLAEVAGVGLTGRRLGQRHAAEGREVAVIVGLQGIGHRDVRRDLGELRRHLGDQWRVHPVKDQAHEVGVVEQVLKLAGDVAVVDVDRHRAHLENRDEGDDVLDAVLRVQADVVTGLDTAGLQEVGQLVGLGLQSGEGDDVVPHLHSGLVGNGVDGVFKEIGDVQGHGTRLEHVLVFRYRDPHERLPR